MALPQYKNYRAARNQEELVTPSLFRVLFIPPAGIQAAFELLPDYVLSVSGLWVDKNSSEVVQQQVGHIRTNHASDDPGDNTINFSINFSMFLNADKTITTYNGIRDWRKLVFDYDTGIRGEKRNYSGSVIVEKLSRSQEIVAKRTVYPCFPINDLPLFEDLDFTATDGVQLNVEFVADDHIDLIR